MKNTVNGLKSYVDLGEWRGHEIEYWIEKGEFKSTSAGVTGKSLAEVKRLIDEQEKKTYVPVSAYRANTSMFGRSGVGDPFKLVRPAQSVRVRFSRENEPEVWAIGPDGKRGKYSLNDFVPATPVNLRKIELAKQKYQTAKAIEKEADKILAGIERAPMPEEKTED